MTVAELIEALADLPLDAEVHIIHPDDAGISISPSFSAYAPSCAPYKVLSGLRSDVVYLDVD